MLKSFTTGLSLLPAHFIISKDIPDNVVVVQGTETTYRKLCTFDEYIEKQRKRMAALPVSDILFTDRTEDQWTLWKQELIAFGGGFDL